MRFKPKTKLRILVLVSQELMPPETIPEGVEKEKQLWRTEYDIISTLKSMEHEVYPVGLKSDLAVIANARDMWYRDTLATEAISSSVISRP